MKNAITVRQFDFERHVFSGNAILRGNVNDTNIAILPYIF